MPTAQKSSVGLEMFYEVSGTGAPIVLVPGGLMIIDQMRGLIDALAKTRQVITIEPQAHGRTADIDRPMTYEHLADDVVEFLGSLGIRQADVCGFSVGAGVSLQTAIRHPESSRKLVFLSGVFKGDGEYPEIRGIASTFAPDSPILTMNRDAYIRAAGSADGWPRLVERMRLLVSQSYDWSSQVAALRAPVLIVAGDTDTLPVAHAVEMFRLLGGENAANALGGAARGQLAVLPGTNHFTLLKRLDLLLPIVSSFLGD